MQLSCRSSLVVSYARSQGGSPIGFASLFILGVVLSFLWIGITEQSDTERIGRKPSSRRPDRTNAAISALAGGLVLARVVFVILHLTYYQENPNLIIAFWQGGLSASGGILGGILGVVALSWKQRKHLWSLLDDLAIPALIISMSAWLGCWIEGVAYGNQVPLNWGWLMNSDPFEGDIARWPTQITGLLLSLVAFLALLRAGQALPPGVSAGISLSAITLILVFVGLFRADPSMLLWGQRLDVLGPATLLIIGFGLTTYCWRRESKDGS